MVEKLYQWATQYPDGSIGSISAEIPGVGHAPLIARDPRTITALRAFAELHRKRTGQRVWLRTWDKFTDGEDLP